MSMETVLAYAVDYDTQCKNLHQKFKCTHTMSSFLKIFQVTKLTVTLFSTT